MKEVKRIITPPGDEDCPADVLMLDFRKYLQNKLNSANYPKNIEIKGTVIKYLKEHADYYNESDNNIIFMWDDIPEEELPPLAIKLYKKNNKWYLLYLKEQGEDLLLIQGKQRKGMNKHGVIVVEKEEERKR